jgi:sodium-dependent dicarboxylate transporter 2/3/5
VLLWIFGKQLGVDANTAAILPIVVFSITGILTAKDLQELNWSVLWMVAGGFALGLALNDSGLAKNAIDSIPFGGFSPLIILIISGLICYILSNFISNTATAALLMPILAVVCRGIGNGLSTIGGTPTVLIGIAIAASAAMCLPISTPPNAIAYSSGMLEQKHIVKLGVTIGVLGLVLGYLLVFLVGELHLIW